jgi:hypothetical protein
MPRNSSSQATRRQGIYWLLTIPHYGFTPFLPPGVGWIRGQLERGEGGFLHWQLCIALLGKGSCRQVRDIFGPYHCELSRSEAAQAYVWKEETAIVSTRFELGTKPFQRNKAEDWEQVWNAAAKGDFLSIPAQVSVF